MKKKYQYLWIILVLMVITIAGCGKKSAPPTGTVTGTVSFGGVNPAAAIAQNKYPSISFVRNNPSPRSISTQTQKIIRFKAGLSQAEIERAVAAMGGKIHSKIYGTQNDYSVIFTSDRAFSDKVNTSEYNENIVSADDDVEGETCANVPTDPKYSDQWNLPMMYLPDAWDITTGSASVIVAVVDSGVSLNHEDLADNILRDAENNVIGYNFVDNNTNVQDNYMHGTMVAGIIAAKANNGVGIAGVCWNVKIMPVKVVAADGFGNASDCISGINYAVEHGAKVINISLVFYHTYTPLSKIPAAFKEALDNAAEKGVTVVAAAGNYGDTSEYGVRFPARYPTVIAVAALGKDGNRAWYSSYGPEVAISAPGGSRLGIESSDIPTTSWDSLNGNGYMYVSGTSISAPHIAGLVALMYSVTPDIRPDLVKRHLQTWSIAKGDPIYYGAGLPNAYSVLTNKSAITMPEVKVFAGNPDGTVEAFGYADGNGNYTLSLQPGTKYICAFLDKNMNSKVDTGDRFIFVKDINVVVNGTQTVNLTLLDEIPAGVSMTLSEYLIQNLK